MERPNTLKAILEAIVQEDFVIIPKAKFREILARKGVPLDRHYWSGIWLMLRDLGVVTILTKYLVRVDKERAKYLLKVVFNEDS